MQGVANFENFFLAFMRNAGTLGNVYLPHMARDGSFELFRQDRLLRVSAWSSLAYCGSLGTEASPLWRSLPVSC